MKLPIVSIGMPVYNDIRFLKAAIESVLVQTFTNFELIISDDGSTDGSETICREYAVKDHRITFYRQEKNIGISKNMEFLLQKATCKYFMWAGNDDLWNNKFIETLVAGFSDSPEVVSVFCPMYFINEENEKIEEYGVRASDYSGSTAFERLKKLVKIFDDSFGYGLFLREKIAGVRFPVWWWVNKKCAYNNIYPTLCYYLTKGDFRLVGDEPMWFNRLKQDQNINHKIPYNLTFIRGFLSFSLRKINLVVISLKNICLTKGSLHTMLMIAPFMLYRWFFIPVFLEFKGRIRAYSKKKISFW